MIFCFAVHCGWLWHIQEKCFRHLCTFLLLFLIKNNFCSLLCISLFVINISANTVETSLPPQELQARSVSWFSSCWKPQGFFFFTLLTSHTGGGIVVLPQEAKTWAKGQKKRISRQRQQWAADVCWFLQPRVVHSHRQVFAGWWASSKASCGE